MIHRAFKNIAMATFCLLALNAFADEPLIDFENDLIPVFTKSGCNAGACHGAALGRGGFKLSLYGGNPADDYEAIVRQLEGRRINHVRPEASLLLLKPTESIEHGGGFRFDFGDESADRIIDWIKQGASSERQRSLEQVEITPRRIASTIGQATKLKATAKYTDGTRQDVTRWTIFKAEDASAVEIEDESGQATALRRGRHIVVARYLNQVVPIEIIVPLNDSKADLAKEPRWNFIDDEVLQSLEALRLSVSPLADKATFERRITLDLTGRLPKSATKTDADRAPLDRTKLVEKLLESEAFNEYWTMKLAKLLRIRPQRDGDMRAATKYHRWLYKQLQQDVGYDRLARDLILAMGDTHENGPANFYRTVNGAREQAEFVSELFMGSRLRCANCHNHPLDHWTQDDYHGLAAIFAKIESGQVIKPKPSGEVTHPRTQEAAVAKIPGKIQLGNSKPVDDLAHNTGQLDERSQLADWLTNPKNPYFAKAIVNRLWKSMMGRGLVEPADDFRATNPATHPALLDKLADDFIASGYSLRHTLKLIATSATYTRTANALHNNKDDDRFYSHAKRRTLPPEVLADAISDVLGVHEKYGEQALGTRAVALLNPKTPSTSLDVLGRCGREASCETESVATGWLPQKLHLFNGALLNARIGHPEGRLEKSLAAKIAPADIIREFYRVGLTRTPSNKELNHWTHQLQSQETDTERREFLEDFVWGLLTSREFVTIH